MHSLCIQAHAPAPYCSSQVSPRLNHDGCGSQHKWPIAKKPLSGLARRRACSPRCPLTSVAASPRPTRRSGTPSRGWTLASRPALCNTCVCTWQARVRAQRCMDYGVQSPRDTRNHRLVLFYVDTKYVWDVRPCVSALRETSQTWAMPTIAAVEQAQQQVAVCLRAREQVPGGQARSTYLQFTLCGTGQWKTPSRPLPPMRQARGP